MKNNIYLIIALFIINTTTKSMNAQKLNDEVDSVSYSLGVNIGENIKSQFPDIDLKNFESGIEDVLSEKKQPKIEGQDAQKVIQEYFTKQQAKASEGKIEEGKAFLAENGKRKEVITLESGLQYEIITSAEGPKPTLNDQVTTHYHGTLLDGTVFDSSVDRGQPATFPVSGVIKGWTEALQLMSVGAKWRLYVPYDLAYGERGASAQIGPYTTLIFDVELLKIN
ncbi:MAG: peptidylprolyl isomerase [Crocinitomicaceae bacterium]|jgi:FKBP-type peptidyl-prolyl cis-trans isomerase FklB|nr:peptidylprolyl isomerase [Crocinitomicaceae bacterium]|tara:strand:+ start:914 stop:1585 length:672 start_codon:yes stop_codon:yes gene_type:complete